MSLIKASMQARISERAHSATPVSSYRAPFLPYPMHGYRILSFKQGTQEKRSAMSLQEGKRLPRGLSKHPGRRFHFDGVGPCKQVQTQRRTMTLNARSQNKMDKSRHTFQGPPPCSIQRPEWSGGHSRGLNSGHIFLISPQCHVPQTYLRIVFVIVHASLLRCRFCINYRLRVSIKAIIIIVLGRYSLLCYLDPVGRL